MRYFTFLVFVFIFTLSNNANTILTSKDLDKEITIKFQNTKKDFSEYKQTIIFEFHANFTDVEYNIWEENLKNDKYVTKVVSDKKDSHRLVSISLNTPLNRAVAKELFSISIKAKYIVIENKKMLFNVFVSTEIPQ